MDKAAVKILVVDDDEKLRALLLRYLGSEGFAVSGVADGDGMKSSAGVTIVVGDPKPPGLLHLPCIFNER